MESTSSTASKYPSARLTLTAALVSLLTYFPVGYHYSVLNVAHQIFAGMVNGSLDTGRKLDFSKNETFDEDFAQNFNVEALVASTLALWQAGAAFGSLNACWAMEKFGRKRTLLILANFLQIAGSSAMGFSVLGARSENFLLFMMTGRFVAGLASGLVCVGLRVFLSECSPDAFRGTVNSFGGVVMFLGVISATVLGLPEFLGTTDHFGYLVALCVVPASLGLFLDLFLPSTPKFLYLNRRDREEAEKSLNFYHGSSAEIDLLFKEYDREAKLTMDELGFFDAIKQKSVRLPLFMSFVAGLCFSSTGIDIYDTYSTEIFHHFGLSEHSAQFSSTLFNLAGLFSAILTVFLVDKMPRRKLLLYSLTTCFVCALIVVFMSLLSLISGGHNSETVGYTSVAVLSVATFAYGLGPGAVLEALFAELSPHKIRSAAGAVSETSFWTSNVLYIFAFPLLFRWTGPPAALLFVLPLGLCLAYFWFRLPETGRSSVYQVARNMKCVQDKGQLLRGNTKHVTLVDDSGEEYLDDFLAKGDPQVA
uniref:Major facilitator superfamily (MFS) profile domain-containing protein n=1 Tax=Romanomermis culicivorax TaxID=13658 RepID=A0A915KQW3_ROMCU